MRTKQALKNAFMSLVLQIVLAISGMIIPRFFIAIYGSSVNGLVSSISQFISYMALVEAGVGTAGTVALYKPLADGDKSKISGIVSAAKNFYHKSGIIFLALVVVLVLCYPFIVGNEITNESFVRTMIVILSLNGIVDYFYLGKYRVLLNADQKGYVISGIQIIGTVVMTIVCVVLMELSCSALIVKGVNAAIYILRSLLVGLYVRKHYPDIQFSTKPDTEALNQRWAALLHQIVGMIVNNTAIILLTVFLKEDALVEVSVFSVYRLVASAIFGAMNSISSGLTSGFGEVISKDESDVLKQTFSSYEYVFFLLTFIVYVCMTVLLYPFISIYSASFNDAQYLRWSLVALFAFSGFLQSVRLPGLTMICAAGHYKETQIQAIAEAVINIVIALLLIKPLGMNGVLIGTCVSYLYRSTEVIIYTDRRIVKGSLKVTVFRIIRNLVASGLLIAGGLCLLPVTTESWLGWLSQAVVVGTVSCIVLVGVNYIFEPKEFKALLGRAKEIVKRG